MSHASTLASGFAAASVQTGSEHLAVVCWCEDSSLRGLRDSQRKLDLFGESLKPSQSITHTGLELIAVFLPQSPKCWDYRHQHHSWLRNLTLRFGY